MPLSAPSPIRPTLMFAAIALHGSVKTPLLSLMLHGPSLTPHSLATLLLPTYLIPTCTHVLVDPNTCRRKAASSRVSAKQKALPRPWSWRRWRHRHYLSTIARAPTHPLTRSTHARVIHSSFSAPCCCLIHVHVPWTPAR